MEPEGIAIFVKKIYIFFKKSDVQPLLGSAVLGCCLVHHNYLLMPVLYKSISLSSRSLLVKKPLVF